MNNDYTKDDIREALALKKKEADNDYTTEEIRNALALKKKEANNDDTKTGEEVATSIVKPLVGKGIEKIEEQIPFSESQEKMIDLINAFGEGAAQSIGNLGVGAINLALHASPLLKHYKLPSLEKFSYAGYEPGELKKEHPYANIAGSFAGLSAVPSLGLGGKTANISSRALRALAKASLGAGEGATYSGLSQAAEDPEKATKVALLGAVLGGGLSSLGSSVGAGTQAIFKKISSDWRKPAEVEELMKAAGENLPASFGDVVKSPFLQKFYNYILRILPTGATSKASIVKKAGDTQAGEIAGELSKNLEDLGTRAGEEHNVVYDALRDIYHKNKIDIGRKFDELEDIAKTKKFKATKANNYVKDMLSDLGLKMGEKSKTITGKVGKFSKPLKLNLLRTGSINSLYNFLKNEGEYEKLPPKKIFIKLLQLYRDSGPAIIEKGGGILEKKKPKKITYTDLIDTERKFGEDARDFAERRPALSSKYKKAKKLISSTIKENLDNLFKKGIDKEEKSAYEKYIDAKKDWKQKIVPYDKTPFIRDIIHDTKRLSPKKETALRQLAKPEYHSFLNELPQKIKDILAYNVLKKHIDTTEFGDKVVVKDPVKLAEEFFKKGKEPLQKNIFSKRTSQQFERLKALNELNKSSAELKRTRPWFSAFAHTAHALSPVLAAGGMLASPAAATPIAGATGTGAVLRKLLTSKKLRDMYIGKKIKTKDKLALDLLMRAIRKKLYTSLSAEEGE